MVHIEFIYHVIFFPDRYAVKVTHYLCERLYYYIHP